MSITGLVFGILGVLLFFIGFATGFTWIVGIIFAIIGVTLAALGVKKDGKTGVGIAGLVLSIIALVFNVIMFFACALPLLLVVGAAASM